jgi:cobalt-zinc-cadmium efflux system protein
MHIHSASESKSRTIQIALIVTLLLVVTEFVAGVLGHSLALISDGWHNLTDLPTLILSGVALYFERKPPDERKTYGYQRAGVLAAFVNALLLVAVALFIVYKGYQRIVHPETVATATMLAVGVLALVINAGVAWSLAREHRDLN